MHICIRSGKNILTPLRNSNNAIKNLKIIFHNTPTQYTKKRKNFKFCLIVWQKIKIWRFHTIAIYAIEFSFLFAAKPQKKTKNKTKTEK